MLFKKGHKFSLLKIVFILMGIVFFFLLMSSPEFIEKLPDNRMKFYAKFSLLLIALVLAAYAAYDDIKYERFTTKKLIIIADIIELISLIVLSYLVMQKNDIIDFEKMFRQADLTLCALIFLSCTTLLKIYLKSKRFSKELNKNKP
jgi:cation transport ATPase